MSRKTKRKTLKSISWKFISSINIFLISYFITSSINTALTITIVEFLTKSILYYFYKRFWENVTYGKTTNEPEYYI